MAHVGEKLALGAVGLLGLFLRRPQRTFSALPLRDIEKCDHRADHLFLLAHRIAPILHRNGSAIGAPKNIVAVMRAFSLAEALKDQAIPLRMTGTIRPAVVRYFVHVLTK